MKIRNFSYSLALLAVLAFAGTASAQTASLTMAATVQDSMQLTISTNAAPGATVTGTVDAFALDFGNVNGLGLGTPTTGVTVVASAQGALYTTPINLTPTFSGFAGNTGASITVRAGGSADDAIAGGRRRSCYRCGE